MPVANALSCVECGSGENAATNSCCRCWMRLATRSANEAISHPPFRTAQGCKDHQPYVECMRAFYSSSHTKTSGSATRLLQSRHKSRVDVTRGIDRIARHVLHVQVDQMKVVRQHSILAEPYKLYRHRCQIFLALKMALPLQHAESTNQLGVLLSSDVHGGQPSDNKSPRLIVPDSLRQLHVVSPIAQKSVELSVLLEEYPA